MNPKAWVEPYSTSFASKPNQDVACVQCVLDLPGYAVLREVSGKIPNMEKGPIP